MHRRLKIPLHNIACKNKEEYVEICSLVIAKLDQTIVNQESVILSELKAKRATSRIKLERNSIEKIEIYL